MPNEYQPLVTPPAERNEPALWFAFHRGEMLIVQSEDEAQLPCCLDLSELGLSTVRSLYLGTYGGKHCYVSELEHANALPDGHELQGLRALFGNVDETLAALAGRAFQIMEWDRNHQYCSRCGTPTEARREERSRACPKCKYTTYPPISPAIMVLITRGREILLEQSRTIDASPEESNDYDVFISYAHEEFTWVYENVFVPLKDARTADGRKLEIFFDTSSIRVGSGWQDKISLAIDGSRFIVPVYSETYFKRPYCRFEIKRAHRKWIMADESSRCVLPVMRGKPVILATVDDIQAVSIDEQPGLVAEIIAKILAGLEPKPLATPAQGASTT